MIENRFSRAGGAACFCVSLSQAAARGDVERIVWCIAHKGEVNWSDPEEGGRRTSLHAACEADRRRAAVVLLLNGANM